MKEINLIKKYPKIIEFREVVGVYEFFIEGLDKKLVIKLIKLANNKIGGISNLSVKGKRCSDSYRSIKFFDNEEDALNDALSGFFWFYNSEAEVFEEDWD